MSKSIRFLTDKGFLKLVEEIKKRYSFLQSNKYYSNREYLGNEEIDMVFVNYSEKKITPINLSYRVFFENSIKVKKLGTEGFEQALTRKTLFSKLNNMTLILREYYSP